MVKYIKYFIALISFSSFLSYAQDKPQLVVTTGHHEEITDVSFSGNGRYVASAENKTVKIYDLVMQLEFNSITFSADNIWQVKFSSDNKYLFVFGRTYLYTVTHPEGKVIQKTKMETRADERSFMGPDDKFYYASDWKGLTVYDPVKGEIEKVWKDIMLFNVLYLSKQNIIVGRSVDPADKKKYNLSLFNALTGEHIKSIPLDGGRDGKIFITDKDEQSIVIETDPGTVKIFNTQKFTQVTQVKFPQGKLDALQIYPDKKKIIGIGYDRKLVVFDIATGQLVKEYTGETLNDIPPSPINQANVIYDLTFSDNGKLLAVAYECTYLVGKEVYKAYRIGYYGVSDMKLKHKYDGQDKRFRELFVNKDESRMITYNNSSPLCPKIWDLKKGEIERFYSNSHEIKLVGDIMVLNHFDKDSGISIRAYEFSTMKLLSEYKGVVSHQLEISPDGKLYGGLMYKNIPGQDPTLIYQYLHVWDTETGKEVYSRNMGKADMKAHFLFNKQDQLLLFEGYGSYKVECINPFSGKTVDTFSMKNTNCTPLEFQLDKSGEDILFLKDDSKFYELMSLNIKTGLVTTLIHEEIYGDALVIKFNHDKTRLAVVTRDHDPMSPNKVYLYDWSSRQKIKVIDDLSYPVANIDFGQKTGNIYLGDQNGVVTVFGSDYEKKSIFLTEKERDYMILSPDNYYKTSITSTQGIGFRYKNELYRFDQFDLRYNRPDLVMKGLGVPEAQVSLYKDAWLKRLKRLGFDEQTVNSSSIHAPEISVVGKDNLPYSTLEGSIKFTINASDSLYDLKRVALYVNNVPVYGKNGFAIPGKDIRKYKKDIEVFLGAGRNKITVSVFNSQGAESTRESFVIECTKKFTKPDLYVFAVGVSKYKDSTMNLTYSDKDVNDIVSVFTENNKISQRYGNVYVKLLTNTEATVSNVDAASVFLKNSKPDDQVILFFSGHGLIDQKLDYYLAMSNVDFTNPSSGGLLYSHFQDLFDGLQSRKRLLLIDACHSGEYDKEDISQPVASNSEDHVVEKEFQFRGKKVIGIGNANELVKELFTDIRKETGATVIASSSGTEYSVESSTWKNGAFTYALKDGLSDLKADRNNDKEITLSETREYLIQKVKELTGGKQNPTTRQENIEFDYRLW